MSLRALTWAFDQTPENSGQKFVLVSLADHADEAWSCFPSQDRIAEMTGIASRTVRRHLEALERQGYLRREERRSAAGVWASHRYYLTQRDSQPEVTPVAPAAENPVADGQTGHRPNRPTVTMSAEPTTTTTPRATTKDQLPVEPQTARATEDHPPAEQPLLSPPVVHAPQPHTPPDLTPDRDDPDRYDLPVNREREPHHAGAVAIRRMLDRNPPPHIRARLEAELHDREGVTAGVR